MLGRPSAIDQAAAFGIVRRLSYSCGKAVRARERCGFASAPADRSPKHLSETARTGVAHFECDLDETARCFPDQFLRLQHALSGYELQRRDPGGLLEHAREMEGLSSANSASFSIEMLSARCART
jgi:hypothetical protein